MADGRFVAYYRVSTERQGKSGLGLDAQRAAVAEYLNGGGWQVVGSEEENESGGKNDRPALARAIELCKLHDATLIVAKLDRLSRNAAFLMNLKEGGVDFVATDMPTANRMVVGIMASIAEGEGEMISARTKAALAAAKARGVKLGGYRQRKGERGTPEALAEETRKRVNAAAVARVAKADERAALLKRTLDRINPDGKLSLRKVAACLSDERIRTARGGTVWSAMQVKRLYERLEGAGA